MDTTSVQVLSTGKYVPKTVVTNDDLTKWMDTSDEWIKQRTGIEQRYISDGENTSDLCIKAAEDTLKGQDLDPGSIGLIIVATVTPDTNSPSVANKVQSAIKATNAMAFDLSAACSGFIYALSVAEKMLRHMPYDHALIIGGEVLSKTIDWSDRKTAVLFGDGAGGVLLKKAHDSNRLYAEDMHSDGNRGDALTIGAQDVNNPLVEQQEENKGYLKMDGRSVFNFVTRTIPSSIESVVSEANLSMEDVDYILLHQANARIIEIVAKKVSVPLSKFPMNIQQYGNTSAASLPILLDDYVKNGQLVLGSKQKIVLSAFGGGLTWGTILIEL
ncbi:beta-ketoacyl-ACP synthase III [Alkalibacterium sp. MB6]|uniref:beta-ketoacyl-ACP synthase III n=1 Tax=Alkalibacterium sp. MB6 TaxID=2081965 RepID=UPI00137970CE|nr:beta-ketoacyl-ACP synthase III [Alkalibacterium sp. MB6]